MYCTKHAPGEPTPKVAGFSVYLFVFYPLSYCFLLCICFNPIAIHHYGKCTKARKAIKIFCFFLPGKKHVPASRTLPHYMFIYKFIHTTKWLDKERFQVSDKAGRWYLGWMCRRKKRNGCFVKRIRFGFPAISAFFE